MAVAPPFATTGAALVSGPSGRSGSRKGRFNCTGPAGAAIASATARFTTPRACTSDRVDASGSGSWANHLAWRP